MTKRIPPTIVLEGLYSPSHDKEIHWKREMIEPLFLYQTTANQIAPFFTSFIFKPIQTKRKRYVCGIQSAYTKQSETDWQEWMHALFRRKHWLHALANVAESFGHWHPQVWIMVPYPYPLVKSTMQQKTDADWSRTNDATRLHMLTSWMHDFLIRWRNHPASKHIHLGGFVWGRESIPPFDRSLITRWNDAVHQTRLGTIWLANYKGLFVDQWRDLGFDHCSIFAQYTGATENRSHWVSDACNYSLVHGTGLQIICGKGARFDEDHLYEYLRQKVVYTQLGGDSPFIYRFPNHSLYELYTRDRSVYDRLFFSIS